MKKVPIVWKLKLVLLLEPFSSMILPGCKVEKWNDSLYVNELIYTTFVHVKLHC